MSGLFKNLNESKHEYKTEDFPEGSKILFNDGEEWIVVKPGMRGSGSRRKSNEITIKPFNKLAKDKNVSLSIDVDLDFLNANMKSISESLNESKKLTSSQLSNFLLDLIYTAAQYTSEDLESLAGQSPSDLDDAIKMVLDYIPSSRKRKFIDDAEKMIQLKKLDESELNERNTKLYVYPSSKKDHQMISNWLTRSNFHAEEDSNSFMFPVAGQQDADATEIALDKEFSKLGANARFVLEGRQQIKRKYRDYPAVRVNEKTPIRNKVIEFVGKRFVTEEEMMTFLTSLTEERGKEFNTKQWFGRNQRYFESFTNRGQRVMTLSKYGKRVLDGIINPAKNKQMVTESIGLFKNSIFESLNESTKFQGKDILPNWLSSRDFGSLVKTDAGLRPGEKYFLQEPGMDNWQGEFIYQGKSGRDYIFNDALGEMDPITFTDRELKDAIKNKEIYHQL